MEPKPPHSWYVPAGIPAGIYGPTRPTLSPCRSGVCVESGAKSGFNRVIERLLSEYKGIVIDEEKGGKRCEKTIVANQALANVFAYNDSCRVVTLQVAPGNRNHIVRTGRIEGDSLCYVMLALNDLAPNRVDSRTADACLSFFSDLIVMFYWKARLKRLLLRMVSTASLFVLVNVASKDMALSSGASHLRFLLLCGTLVRCEEGIPSLCMTGRLPFRSG